MLVPGRFERRCRAGEDRFLHLLHYKRYIEADDTNLASINVAGIISQGSDDDTDHAIVLVMNGEVSKICGGQLIGLFFFSWKSQNKTQLENSLRANVNEMVPNGRISFEYHSRRLSLSRELFSSLSPTFVPPLTKMRTKEFRRAPSIIGISGEIAEGTVLERQVGRCGGLPRRTHVSKVDGEKRRRRRIRRF